MTKQEALARGNAAIWDFREAETAEDRMRAAYEIDEVSPIIMRGHHVVSWPRDPQRRRQAYKAAAAIIGELLCLASYLSAIGCVALMLEPLAR